MHKVFIISSIVLTLMLLSLISQQSIPSIQYFPPSKDITFNDAKTDINYLENKKGNNLIWSIYSNTSEKVYLRQDISLLYVNGFYKGVLRKWKQNVDTLTSKHHFTVESDALVQTITYHFGETHNEQGNIQSIQHMTVNQMYVSEAAQSKPFKQAINKEIKQTLSEHWNQLISDNKLDPSNYILIPLTELITYQSQALPNQTMENTDKIIGLLWEGIYKKYLVLLDEESPNHYMPLIMLAKDNSHLILLFKLGDENHQYIQHIN